MQGNNSDISVNDIILKKLPPIFLPDVIAFASSTGGQEILINILSKLKGMKVAMPIFITQHIASDFLDELAENLSSASGLECLLAREGMVVEKGIIYIAPADLHLLTERTDNTITIKLSNSPPENSCRPAADPMFRSLVDTYGGNKILAVILTGMGEDGRRGCEHLVNDGGVVIAQDYPSSSVWGMPGAVAKAGICSALLPPDKIAETIIDFSGGKIL